MDTTGKGILYFRIFYDSVKIFLTSEQRSLYMEIEITKFKFQVYHKLIRNLLIIILSIDIYKFLNVKEISK